MLRLRYGLFGSDVKDKASILDLTTDLLDGLEAIRR